MNICSIIDHALGPPVCQLCGARGIGPEICAGCYRDLPRAPRQCPVCARPVLVPGTCGGCLRRAPAFDRARVPFVYAFPVNRLIHRLKYGGVQCHARLLGEITGHALKRVDTRPELIIPVPLHRARLRERGFDQARVIAWYVSRVTGIGLGTGLCRRRTNTPPLWSLPPEERRRVLRQAFECRGRPPARVVLFDDILTTGSTAEALTRVLRAAGSRDVEVWAVARSPATGGTLDQAPGKA